MTTPRPMMLPACCILAAAMLAAAPATTRAAGAGAPTVALALDGAPAFELPRPVRSLRVDDPVRPVEMGSLQLLQAAAGGAITILVESVGETGDTPTAEDNDFTRINAAVQAVSVLGDGTVVRLVGTFDWSEEHAAASWAEADYGILAPPGISGVTLRAPSLGAAEIVGPGELADPDIYWEGFLGMWGGLYQNWTVENLVIRGFDWPLGMFYDGPGGGSTEDFNGVTIRNNRIVMHADTPGNYSAGVGEVFQNIALHLGFGENQTIEGNEIIIPGDGAGDDSDPGAVLKASCVALQSNTSGGNAYDGLRIVDNTIRITGAPAAVPEIIYGIWENGHAHASDIEVSGNLFVNEHPGNDPALNFQRAFRVTSHSSATTTVAYSGNTVIGANIAVHWIGDNYTSKPPAATVRPVIVSGNTLLGNGTGVWVHTDDGGADPTKMSKAALSFNRLVGNAVGVRSDDAEVTAENNWWGCSGGPGETGCDAALATGVAGFLDADPWLVLGVDTAAAVLEVGFATSATATVQTNSDGAALGPIGFPAVEIGFSAVRGAVSSPVSSADGAAATDFTATGQGIGSVTALLDNAAATATLLVTEDGAVTVRSVEETGSTPTLLDNDYTRVNDLVQMVGDGVTVLLEGTFDWTESLANIAWSRGSDGIPDTGDDYAIAAPAGFAEVTIGAAEPGGAVVQGPGDVPTLDWETFLGLWNGSYFGWTVENLDIRGFDWSIAMFYTTGADFHGVSILDNRIEMPADEPGNFGADIGEPWQNVGIHLAGGFDQTIAGNEFVIPGDALADTSNPEVPLKAASIALQSNTHGGSRYDGLRIVDNVIRITGAQSADPEWVYGIWENGHAHESDIEISGNSFINEHPGNDPALNLQRAFRVTSHSSATTTVRYADNTVTGANIAIHWIGDNYTSGPAPGLWPVVVEGNTLLGNGTAVWVHTDGLEAPDKAAAATADSLSDLRKAVLRFNRIVGNGIGVRSDDAEVMALDNWWGCNEGPGADDCDAAVRNGSFGFLDTDTWLELGLSAVPGQVQVGGSSVATAVLQSNADAKNGLLTPPVPDGTPVVFAATGGAMSPTAGETLQGSAASTYTAGTTVGEYSVSATVDSETVSVGVTVVAWADLAISVTPESQHLDDGEPAALTVTVTNDGPLAAPASVVEVDLPGELSGVAWTCAGSGGGVCTAAGAGDVDELVDLPVGASVVFTIAGTVPDPFAGSLEASATVAPPAGLTDPDTDDNSDTADIIAVESIFADDFESGDTDLWSSSVGLAP